MVVTTAEDLVSERLKRITGPEHLAQVLDKLADTVKVLTAHVRDGKGDITFKAGRAEMGVYAISLLLGCSKKQVQELINQGLLGTQEDIDS